MQRYSPSLATMLLLIGCQLGAAAPLDDRGEDPAGSQAPQQLAASACSIDHPRPSPMPAPPSNAAGVSAPPTVPDWVMLAAAAIAAGLITGRRLRPPPP